MLNSISTRDLGVFDSGLILILKIPQLMILQTQQLVSEPRVF